MKKHIKEESKSRIDGEKTKKRTPRFRVLDAVIILVVVLAVVGVYFRYNIMNFLTSRQNIKDYVVTFSIEDIRWTTPEYYINVGDRVYFRDDGELMGTLIEGSDEISIALITTPSSEIFVMDDGTVEEAYYPEKSRINAKGRMVCSGTYTDEGGFLLDGSEYLSPGQTVAVQTERVTLNITIQDIQLQETE